MVKAVDENLTLACTEMEWSVCRHAGMAVTSVGGATTLIEFMKFRRPRRVVSAVHHLTGSGHQLNCCT